MSKQSKKCNNPIMIYCIIYFSSLLLLLLFLLLSHGKLINQYFFYDKYDTGMDFFHSIEYVNGRAPYELFNTLYPPLANLFFYIILRFIPESVIENWHLDFSESVNMRTTTNDLRVHQATFLAFLIFVMFCTLFMFLVIDLELKKEGIIFKYIVCLSSVFSYGYMFAVERGNVLLLCVPLTMFFAFNYDSDSIVLRELSLISLAVAAGIKVYPALLGLLLIKKCKWKEAIRACIYGILSFILPCFAFEEGLGAIHKWLKVLFSFGKQKGQPWIGNGFSNILHRIKLYIWHFFRIDISETYFGCITFITLVALLGMVILVKKKWQSVLILILVMILYQSQGDYIFSFISIPMILFMKEEQKLEKENVIPFLGMSLLLAPIPLFYTKNLHYPHTVMTQIVLVVLIIWSFFTKKSKKNSV